MTASRLILDQESTPRFAPHVHFRFDKARDRWTVQAPERLFVPDEIAAQILQRCDGATTIGALVESLAQEFAAPRDEIAGDVLTLLQDMTDKGVLTA